MVGDKRSPSSEWNADRKGSGHLLLLSSTSSSPLARDVDPFISFRILCEKINGKCLILLFQINTAR